jgi:pimeloyl-ACP methyl ester carboxylesterase
MIQAAFRDVGACLCAALVLLGCATGRDPLSGPDVRQTEFAIVRTLSVGREVHDVATRGVHVRLLVEKTDPAAGVVVLFAGGAGATKITPEGSIGQLAGNFLVRSRAWFQRERLVAVVYDSPSDYPHDIRGFHHSSQFAADVGAVIRHLRSATRLPVWLVGTSRGTVSVASAATQLRENRPDGVVFTASLLADSRSGSVFDFELEKIEVPTLIVHHSGDGCALTPPGQVPAFQRRLTGAKPLKVMMFDGGFPQGDPCQARHYHGFQGIEPSVVAEIARWIQHPAP